jgi:hypothetical protein
MRTGPKTDDLLDFDDCLQKGKAGEDVVVGQIEPWFEVTEVPMAIEHWCGFDRVIVSRRTGLRLTVEIKTDFRCVETGHVFAETRFADRPGWAVTSLAQVLLLHLPDWSQILWVNMPALKLAVPDWVAKYGTVSTRKTTSRHGIYGSVGCPVPLSEVYRYAQFRFWINDEPSVERIRHY